MEKKLITKTDNLLNLIKIVSNCEQINKANRFVYLCCGNHSIVFEDRKRPNELLIISEDYSLKEVKAIMERTSNLLKDEKDVKIAKILNYQELPKLSADEKPANFRRQPIAIKVERIYGRSLERASTNEKIKKVLETSAQVIAKLFEDSFLLTQYEIALDYFIPCSNIIFGKNSSEPIAIFDFHANGLCDKDFEQFYCTKNNPQKLILKTFEHFCVDSYIKPDQKDDYKDAIKKVLIALDKHTTKIPTNLKKDFIEQTKINFNLKI